MRKLFFILAIIFTILSVAFAILPMGTLAFLPIGLALIFSLATLSKSEENQRKIPKTLLLICGICSLATLSKEIFIKDEVEADTQFEQTKIENQKEAQKDLEELEGLE